jgi:hypothetical protein
MSYPPYNPKPDSRLIYQTEWRHFKNSNLSVRYAILKETTHGKLYAIVKMYDHDPGGYWWLDSVDSIEEGKNLIDDYFKKGYDNHFDGEQNKYINKEFVQRRKKVIKPKIKRCGCKK